MFLVALTGGIAAGKSTVSEFWESLGAEVIDADELAREVVRPGTSGFDAVIGLFGASIVSATGDLDRKALGRIVFSDSTKRSALESLIHPLIRDLARKRLSESSSAIVVYVIPLLVESKNDLPFDCVVTVETSEIQQLQRLVSKRGMSDVEANERLNSQVSAAQRANIADYILNSNQDIHLLRRDAEKLFETISQRAKDKGARA